MAPGTITSLFELTLIAETAAQEFYAGLANKFSHEPDISQFWRNMADDERQHIKILEDIQKSLTPAQLKAPIVHSIFQIAEENANVRINEVLNSVRDLDDAYALALRWENSDFNKVFEFLATNFMPMEDQGKTVQVQVLTHTNRLMMFLKAFDKTELRKSIKAQDDKIDQ